ncbi:hypothetical protein [Rhodococcus sp. ACT016]|uniref:hypothetical protein n=1 Tax=Rhodococcus sp. ACT016 TaxID=3134808 RepID=UPI003D2DEC63
MSLVLFDATTSDVSLPKAGEHLREIGLSVVDHGSVLEVSYGEGGPVFAVEFLGPEASGALAESLSIPRRRSGCFRIGIGDLDEALDEINTLIELQAALQSLAPDAWLFNEWNRNLVDSTGTVVQTGS